MATHIRRALSSDAGALVLLALSRVLLHTLTNGLYGFHRDELATLDDARFLDWGYVAYPPLTPLIAHAALALFGPSLIGLRLFSALAQGAALILTGLMARELGGKRQAQLVAALAVAISPMSVVQGAVFQYVSFDYLCWVLAAWCLIRLLKTADPRWWLAIGATVGIGMMTKYTMVFLAAGIAAGTLLTSPRSHLKSRWLWYGVALSLLIFLPNLLWQVRHDFVSLDFLRHIHARDIRIGRTDFFLVDQVVLNLFVLPLCVAGLLFVFRGPDGQRNRALGWTFAISFALIFLARGRGYYTAPLYPILYATGAVAGERWVASLRLRWALLVRGHTWFMLAAGGALSMAFFVPIAPVNSPWWRTVNKVSDMWREEIGWPDLADTVAQVRDSLPAEERAHAGVLVGNYGEAGAINLYGPAHGLPPAISGTNSAWLRGYPDPPPQTVIAIGLSRKFLEENFESCQLAARVTNRYGVVNEETKDHPDAFVCRRLRKPWNEFWKRFRNFG